MDAKIIPYRELIQKEWPSTYYPFVPTNGDYCPADIINNYIVRLQSWLACRETFIRYFIPSTTTFTEGKKDGNGQNLLFSCSPPEVIPIIGLFTDLENKLNILDKTEFYFLGSAAESPFVLPEAIYIQPSSWWSKYIVRKHFFTSALRCGPYYNGNLIDTFSNKTGDKNNYLRTSMPAVYSFLEGNTYTWHMMTHNHGWQKEFIDFGKSFLSLPPL